MGGHLAIIPDADTQYFIKFIGTIKKSLKRWMASKNKAWIDAVKTNKPFMFNYYQVKLLTETKVYVKKY
uniref:Uncharacterized protein n=1 Tax=Ciona intestinalis TaxID=7719 RepID=H2Y1Y0_CIOIN